MRDSNARAEAARREMQLKAIRLSQEAKQLQTVYPKKAADALLKAPQPPPPIPTRVAKTVRSRTANERGAQGSNRGVKVPPAQWKPAFGQQASGQPRFRVGAFPARVVGESQPSRAGRQPDGGPVTAAAPDPRAELQERRDADARNAQRLADDAYSEEALVIARRVLTAQRALVPESDPELAAALMWFASIAKRFAQFEAARAALKEALQIQSKARGADDWRTIDAKYALERAERLVGLDEQRRLKYRAAQEVLVRSARLKNPKPDDGAQILQLEREALTLMKEALGENHPEYAFCLDSFVSNTSFLRSNPQSDEAKRLGEETRLIAAQAQAIRRQTLGERHPDYALSLYSLPPTSRGDSNSNRQATLRQVLEIRAKALGKHHPAYLRALIHWALLFSPQRASPRLRRSSANARPRARDLRRRRSKTSHAVRSTRDHCSKVAPTGRSREDGKRGVPTQAQSIRRVAPPLDRDMVGPLAHGAGLQHEPACFCDRPAEVHADGPAQFDDSPRADPR